MKVKCSSLIVFKKPNTIKFGIYTIARTKISEKNSSLDFIQIDHKIRTDIFITTVNKGIITTVTQ